MNAKPKITFGYINKLAIPALLAGIAEPLLSITDTAFVGNIAHHATEALAAVGIAGSFLSALIWILAQSRSAISAIIARYYGAKNLQHISNMPAQIIAINVGLSLVLYLVTVFFIEGIFKLYNASGLVLEYAVSYYKIRAVGLPFTLFVFSVFGIFRGLQNTFWPMIISLTGLLLNVALDYILIYGIPHVITPLHVNGAAYASFIAQMVMAVMAVYLLYAKTDIKLRFSLPFHHEIRHILFLSANLFIRAVSLNVAIYFANSYATAYGNNYIAAHTIAFQIWLFFSFFIDGYASVGNIVSGRLLGERDYKNLWQLSKDLSRFGIVIALILLVVCFVFYYPIGVLFTKNREILEIFYSIFWIVLLMQPLNALAFVFDGLFKGLAEAVILRNTLLVATFLGFVPVLWLCDYFGLKIYGIWIAFIIWMFLRTIILVLAFKRKYLVK